MTDLLQHPPTTRERIAKFPTYLHYIKHPYRTAVEANSSSSHAAIQLKQTNPQYPYYRLNTPLYVYLNIYKLYQQLYSLMHTTKEPYPLAKAKKKTTTLSHTHTSVLRAIKVRPQNGTHSRGGRSEEQSLIIPTTNPQSQ